MARRPTDKGKNGKFVAREFKMDFCEMLIDHMAGGLSFQSFGGKSDVRVSRATLDRWNKTIPEFAEAYAVGHTASLLWWEERGKNNLLVPKGYTFNTGAYVFNMGNRFQWRSVAAGDVQTDQKVVVEVKTV